MQFDNVSATAKGNVYFDGKVISHAITLADGSHKTLGVILPGSYHFATEAAELMEIVSGACQVTLDGRDEVQDIPEGGTFDVPANSGFTIAVADGSCHYVCSFIS